MDESTRQWFTMSIYLLCELSPATGEPDQVVSSHLQERLTVHSHISRTIAVRAAVDWSISVHEKEDHMGDLLEHLGVTESFATPVLHRMILERKAFAEACAAWRERA